MINTIISGTGCCIPEEKVENSYFMNHKFYVWDNGRYVLDSKPIAERIAKLAEITGIEERRYAREDQLASDLGATALKNIGYDLNSLDRIIVATNFGDVKPNHRLDIVPSILNNVPSIASRIKNKAGITNPRTIAYDIIYGCPGWLEGVIQAHEFIQGGFAQRIAVIGTETLSRVCDPHDMDSMIYANGAGAVILEAKEGNIKRGILSSSSRTDANFSEFLTIGPSNNPDYPDKAALFLKMRGPDLYKYAVRYVPEVIKESLEKANVSLDDLKMILIHQANEILDNAILEKFGLTPEQIKKLVPMIIGWAGNSSVATLPILLDLVLKGKMQEYKLESRDLVALASVGAGMNRNSMVYKMPNS